MEFTDEWSEHKFENIFDIKNGLNKGKDYFGECIRILNYMDVNKYELNTENTIKGLVELTDDEIERYSVKPNDLFFTRTSETSEEIGLISAYMGNTIKCVFSGFLLRARPKIDLNSLFFAYYLRSPRQRNNIIKFSSITTRALISGGNLSKMKIKYPSIEEQNKIANLFLILDKKVELLEKKYREYQCFKKYLMQKLFAQELRFDFNDEWKNIPFKKLLKEVNEKTTVNNQHEILSSTKEGIFTQKDYFADRNVASKDNTGYKVLRKNQIVLSPQNLWMGNINVNTEFDIGIVSPSYKIYETTDLIDINYFKHIVKLPRLIYEYTCASEQGASIVRRNLNKQLFNEITIKVPSLNEQKKIGNLFDTCDEKIKNIDKNIQDMKEFKKGLLQQMFVVRINWRCNFKLAKSPSFNKHLLILKNKIIFIIIK